jgi:hypothetical protein
MKAQWEQEGEIMRDFIIPTDDRDMGTPAKVGAPVTLTGSTAST